jgi:hypothetical protein
VQGAHARSGEGVIRRAHHVRTELITIFVLFQQNRLHLTKVPHEIRPGNLGLALIQALLQIYFQAEGQETGDDMADRRIIPMMIDRPDFQGGFLLSKGSFHPPQAFLCLGHLGRRRLVLVLRTNLPSNRASRGTASASMVALPLATLRKRA